MGKDKDEDIKQAYFLWLCNLVNIGRTTRDQNRRDLAWSLHQKEFYWSVPNDDNRAEDGKKLRENFADAVLTEDCRCLDGPCSVLEMLIGLSQRIEYILREPSAGNRVSRWFWELVNNLELLAFTDDDLDSRRQARINDIILDNLLERRYSQSGKNGLFPLVTNYGDQRKIEIWYQLMHYLDENYPN